MYGLCSHDESKLEKEVYKLKLLFLLMSIPDIQLLLHDKHICSCMLCFFNITFPTKVGQHLTMDLLGMTKTRGHCLQWAISKATFFHSVHIWKLSIWKTCCCQDIKPAQILTVKILTCESASQSRDTPAPSTSVWSENRLMIILSNYPVTYCFSIIACRCSPVFYYLSCHRDWKSQAT